MKIGNAWGSMNDQNLDRQFKDLYGAGCEKVFLGTISGVMTLKPALEKAGDLLNADDTLGVWKLDRLGGWMVEFLSIRDALNTREIGDRQSKTEWIQRMGLSVKSSCWSLRHVRNLKKPHSRPYYERTGSRLGA